MMDAKILCVFDGFRMPPIDLTPVWNQATLASVAILVCQIVAVTLWANFEEATKTT